MKIKLNNRFLKNNIKKEKQKFKLEDYIKLEEEPCVLKYNFGDNISESEIMDNNIDNSLNVNTIRKRRRKVILDELEEESGDKQKLKLFSNFFLNKNKLSKNYYVLFFAMFSLASVSVYITAKTYNLFETEKFAVFSSIDKTKDVEIDSSISSADTEILDVSLDYQDNNTSNIDTKQLSNTGTSKSSNNTKNSTSTSITKTSTTTKSRSKPIVLNFTPPLSGEIQKIYSIDKVIYSKTLDMWKIHDGIDIACELQDNVKAIERGTVVKIYDDSFLGTTIIIEHPNSYKSVYSNLDETVNVKLNKSVKKGEIIGKVSNTAVGEIKDASHLHFELLKNNQKVDPTYIFK